MDAGDHPIHGTVDEAAKAAAELRAADRLYGLLPEDQAAELRALWDEFEANETPDARFAKSVDRFQPPNMNLVTQGGSWVDYKVTWPVFEQKMAPKIQSGAPKLWDWLAPKVEAFLARLTH